MSVPPITLAGDEPSSFLTGVAEGISSGLRPSFARNLLVSSMDKLWSEEEETGGGEEDAEIFGGGGAKVGGGGVGGDEILGGGGTNTTSSKTMQSSTCIKLYTAYNN